MGKYSISKHNNIFFGRTMFPLPSTLKDVGTIPPNIPVPKKSQTRFYSFIMYKIIPRILKRFRGLSGQEKYFWDKNGMHRWFAWRINLYWEKHDYIMVIICAIITLYLKEKKND